MSASRIIPDAVRAQAGRRRPTRPLGLRRGQCRLRQDPCAGPAGDPPLLDGALRRRRSVENPVHHLHQGGGRQHGGAGLCQAAAWVALDDAALDAAMRELGVTSIDAAKRARARRLFAAALETPGGLKVQTIHALCTRLLQQFPFEANVAGAVCRARRPRPDRDVGARHHGGAAARRRRARQPRSAARCDRRHRRRRRHRQATSCATPQGARAIARGSTAPAASSRRWRSFRRRSASRPMTISPRSKARSSMDPICRSRNGRRSPRRVQRRQQTGLQDQTARLLAALAAPAASAAGDLSSVFFTDKNEPRQSVITKALAREYPPSAPGLRPRRRGSKPLIERRTGIVCRDRTPRSSHRDAR